MTDRDWYDDSDYENAVEQAEQMTRTGWKVIAGVTGLVGVAAVAVGALCLVAVAGMGYLVMVATR